MWQLCGFHGAKGNHHFDCFSSAFAGDDNPILTRDFVFHMMFSDGRFKTSFSSLFPSPPHAGTAVSIPRQVPGAAPLLQLRVRRAQRLREPLVSDHHLHVWDQTRWVFSIPRKVTRKFLGIPWISSTDAYWDLVLCKSRLVVFCHFVGSKCFIKFTHTTPEEGSPGLIAGKMCCFCLQKSHTMTFSSSEHDKVTATPLGRCPSCWSRIDCSPFPAAVFKFECLQSWEENGMEMLIARNTRDTRKGSAVCLVITVPLWFKPFHFPNKMPIWVAIQWQVDNWWVVYAFSLDAWDFLPINNWTCRNRTYLSLLVGNSSISASIFKKFVGSFKLGSQSNDEEQFPLWNNNELQTGMRLIPAIHHLFNGCRSYFSTANGTKRVPFTDAKWQD